METPPEGGISMAITSSKPETTTSKNTTGLEKISQDLTRAFDDCVEKCFLWLY